MDDYLVLLLADGNLPTGSFVASSGLESYIAHGFLTGSSPLDFIRDSLSSYASTSAPFVSETHQVLAQALADNDKLEIIIERVQHLDELFHSTCLNAVTRRASMAQGVALLTLYSKGFSQPSWLSCPTPRSLSIDLLVEQLKLQIRQRQIHGHLPICWAVLTAVLGLSVGSSFQRLPSPLELDNLQSEVSIFISSCMLEVYFRPQCASTKLALMLHNNSSSTPFVRF
jgi:urease accessory protein